MKQIRSRSPFFFACTLLVAAAIAVAGGCAASDQAASDPSATQPTQPSDNGADADGSTDDSVAGSAQSHAERLTEAMARSSPPATQPAGQRQRPPVRWSDDPRQGGDNSANTNANPSPATQPDAADATGDTASANQTADVDGEQTAPAQDTSRQQLIADLLKKVRDTDEPAMQRALRAATLVAAVDDQSLDGRVLGSLNPSQRSQVQRYHQMVRATMQQLATSEGGLDRGTLHERIDALFDPQPVTIDTLALCRAVSGYGVYETFDDHNFLARQPQRMVVYIEVDHFRTRQTSDGKHEVKLKQEVVLYNESDGLAVWRIDPEQITDISRNKRRDFYIVKLITLPQRLNVGKYRLKVRITDEHGGTIDETTARVQLVADEKLSNNDERQ